jgi:hypothetical protein
LDILRRLSFFTFYYSSYIMAVLDDKKNDGHRWKTAVEKHTDQLPARRCNISDLPYELHTVSMTEKTSSTGLKSARALMLVLVIWAF